MLRLVRSKGRRSASSVLVSSCLLIDPRNRSGTSRQHGQRSKYVETAPCRRRPPHAYGSLRRPGTGDACPDGAQPLRSHRKVICTWCIFAIVIPSFAVLHRIVVSIVAIVVTAAFYPFVSSVNCLAENGAGCVSLLSLPSDSLVSWTRLECIIKHLEITTPYSALLFTKRGAL